MGKDSQIIELQIQRNQSVFVFFLYTLLKLTKESIVTLNHFCVNYFDKHGENVKNIFTLNLQYKYICSNLKNYFGIKF